MYRKRSKTYEKDILDRAYKWLNYVITAINKDDEEELKGLMVCSLMSDEEFDAIVYAKEDGEFLDNESYFRCDGWYFQLSEDFAYSAVEAKSTDRYIIWAYYKDGDIALADIAYWQWGCPFTGDNVSEDVLEQCRKWIEKAKARGYKPHDILKED